MHCIMTLALKKKKKKNSQMLMFYIILNYEFKFIKLNILICGKLQFFCRINIKILTIIILVISVKVIFA